LSTIHDVAKRAGVSPGTVSRVLNNASNVTPEIREKVERVIEELGYVPNVVARSLRIKRTRSLALLIPDITNIFWTTIARGVEDAAQSRDYSVLLCNTDENPTKQLRYLNLVASQRVDGVIIAPHDSNAGQLKKLWDRGIPAVVVDRRIKGWEVDTVCSDSVSGARALVQHLIQLGHKHIAIISGPSTISTAEDRVAGYCIALTEAGIPINPRLIKRGEYRNASGEYLTQQLLDEGLNVTAIFAANNTIAMGVIDALEKRELRIPEDVAIVSFGDFPHDSRFFPFLTSVVQPAYEMGMNAAQLLFSRLDTEGNLLPRIIELPTRLVIRYSCGSHLTHEGECSPVRLPAKDARRQSVLVRSLSSEDRLKFAACLKEADVPASKNDILLSEYDKSDVKRLLKALCHEEPDRLPYLEFCVTSKSVYEYVLGRELRYGISDTRSSHGLVKPEDHIEFAQRLGMDAVTCNFRWQPNRRFEKTSDGTWRYIGGSTRTLADLDDLEPPTSLADQMSYLEHYLHSAQGTGVGIAADFSSFFDSALLAVGKADALNLFPENRQLLEALMDMLLEHQEKVIHTVCSRFAEELAFVVVSDNIAQHDGLLIPTDAFNEIFPPRMQRLIAPAREYEKLVVMHTDGKVSDILPTLQDLGFNAIHPVDPEANDIFALREQWDGEIALVGGFPTDLLTAGSQEEIEEKVMEYCIRLAPNGGYVLGSSHGITQGTSPLKYVAMIHSVQKYGRYGSLGTSL
jgi:LacI family transcriptional regulator